MRAWRVNDGSVRPFALSIGQITVPLSRKNLPFSAAKCRRGAFNERLSLEVKEDVMFKVLPVAAFVAVMSLSPAYAAGECTEAHMKQMDGMIAKMSDAAKKKEATM